MDEQLYPLLVCEDVEGLGFLSHLEQEPSSWAHSHMLLIAIHMLLIAITYKKLQVDICNNFLLFLKKSSLPSLQSVGTSLSKMEAFGLFPVLCLLFGSVVACLLIKLV